MVEKIYITEIDIEQAVRNYRKPNITFLMLADMFGEDEDTRKSARSRIRSLTIQRNRLLQSSFLIDKDRRWVRDEMNKCLAEPLERQIKYYTNFLNASDPKKKEVLKGRSVSDTDIARAKEFPIVELLQSFGVEFKGDFARCIKHDENTASMHYIKNRNTCYCMGCNANIDTISVVQHFKNIGFIDAVKTLI